MKNRVYLYHFLFWTAIYLLWIVVFRSYSFSISKTMTIEFCYLVFITADYYAISSFIIPQFLVKKKHALFITATVAVIALSAWLRALVALQMSLHFFSPASTPDFLTLYLNSFLNISLWVLVITIGKMLLDRIQNQRQLELLEKEKTKNELDLLKAQINPHALFNSINTVYGHIDKNNQAARNILLKFSELLRYQLYDCSSEKVSLEKEIEYLKNYVSFQQLRQNENLVVDFEIEGAGNNLTIAPLLLVVLIENAFKFVSHFPGKENKIVIRLVVQGSVLNNSVMNTVEQQSSQTSTNSNGIGIANLKRRLELLYPHKYVFTNHIENDLYQAHLTIDLS